MRLSDLAHPRTGPRQCLTPYGLPDPPHRPELQLFYPLSAATTRPLTTFMNLGHKVTVAIPLEAEWRTPMSLV